MRPKIRYVQGFGTYCIAFFAKKFLFLVIFEVCDIFYYQNLLTFVYFVL